ncbi:MAG: UDP-N-acetylglucosamine [uncultured bacterium]|uniref:Glycosyltransferase family 1 protein n=1 Tax=candidate division WWE3 bacterium TaxID=2053526 RepID=A0A656PLX8_UNCKA|nr:Glycosyltransferase [candidate division WWE3 bacterium RAAC2_WWE3_1]EKD99389.1 MAG: UDP-N-acetylglucosamine [uncultured bacterium]KKS30169.1 MAG: Glycosyltransferase [candidate division WWE3 bacterium GW2011_GWB1_42_117]KKS55216.1 MAG: Glycosyltransferase [candidate division WWE3 bacterium GW2011_GWD2_42_34]KKT05769.1 MAG: Glycosyltransferase [candidate division WWE3 bacterium GW2011_GWE2_43_18]KKT07341.1 MAG: Glycosyltransferase [candidate division WWE3 bacterium GW2011_GWF2_43_18]KKT0901
MTSVLLITPFFLPNIGGAETYAFELVEYLRSHDCLVNVLTYQPITTPNVRGERMEKRNNLVINRFQWIGFNLFGKLEKYPLINFLYLTPYLLLRSFVWMLFNSGKVDVIDAQGFNSACIAAVLKRIFKKKAVISVMSLYDFKPGNILSTLVGAVISKMDHVIVESNRSKEELISIGIASEKITPYIEWLNLDVFKPYNKIEMKEKLGLPAQFTVLFVGRAIEIKGIDLILESAKKLRNEKISFVFISNAGPMMGELAEAASKALNIVFIPGVPYNKLPEYESAADVAVIPSKYSENSAITVLTAISCGTPVIASRVGAIPSLLTDEVGVLVEPTAESFSSAILGLFKDGVRYNQMQNNCESYAKKHFSIDNASTIYKVYLKVLDRSF